jgi:cytochrome c peroxidase
VTARGIGLLVAVLALCAAAQDSARLPVPDVGSYALPSLGRAADGAVLQADGSPTTLHALFADRIVVLAFVYTSCGDAEGCPLVMASLQRVGRLLDPRTDARARLRVLSLSFDPERDTPARLREMEKVAAPSGLDWRFLTAGSRAELEPILAAYGQAIVPERDSEGRQTGAIAHVVRVFLIDPEGRIRNIYGADLLDPELVIADVLTLMRERESH